MNWLRNNVAVVEQEPILFNTTIAENIRYGNVDATQEIIEQAAKEAHIHDYINQLSDKYNTIVGENGGKLSGGQKQRLAIARAIVRKPSLLLLDEATSGLDHFNEIKIQETIFGVSKTNLLVLRAFKLFILDKGGPQYNYSDSQFIDDT